MLAAIALSIEKESEETELLETFADTPIFPQDYSIQFVAMISIYGDALLVPMPLTMQDLGIME